MVKRESGQVVLVVLLVMVVTLTVVLSILGSSTSDIKTSTNETESLRALSAAESGLEQNLATGTSSAGNVNGVAYNITTSGLGKGSKVFNYPVNIVSGDNAVFWFVSHDSNGNLTC